jgi:DNA repair exonuclease SbcCD ATPase subunit
MKLQSLTIQGFRSFEQQQTLNFGALKPGLYFVSGENQVEPDLEGNGAGKSTLFEAVNWLLFERTSRNLRAAAVATWGGETACGGILELVCDKGEVGVFRTWNPNRLELSLAEAEVIPVTQDQLQGALGWTPAMFQSAVYFAQFNKTFADLAPSEQMKLFSDVLKLDLWDQAAEDAGTRAKQHADALQGIITLLARLEGQAEELLAQDWEAQAEGWEANRRKQAAGARAQVRAAQVAYEGAKTRHKAAQAAAGAFAKVRDRLGIQNRAVGAASAAIDRLETEERKLATQAGKTTCPTCGQAWSQAHATKELKRVQAELAAAKAKGDAEADKAEAILKELVQQRSAEDAREAAAAAETSAAQDLRFAQSVLDGVQSDANPFALKAEDAKRRGLQLAGEMERLNEQITEAEADLAALQFWAKEFRNIRLALVRESLDQLTVEANECLVSLGLRDWAIEFDVERETKSKTISKGFNILVHGPATEDVGAVPWEAWSGGETQRLRLAITLGFANLVCSRMGVQPNVEFWDEPTQWMTKGGIDGLLEVLADRAEQQGKAILLADHRVLDFGGFAGNIHIVKDAKGSRIVL